MKEKKGVSPLIATVILVGIVVLIAILIWFWYGKYLEDVLEKQKVDLEASCVQDVEFSVYDFSCDSEKRISFRLENKGDINIRGVQVVYSTELTGGSIWESSAVNQAVISALQVDLPDNVTAPISLEITPNIGTSQRNKFCDNVVQYATITTC